MPASSNPFAAYAFRLSIDNEIVSWFTEVRNLKIRVEPMVYREGGTAPAVRLLPGRTSYEPVQLRWGVSNSPLMWDWLMTGVEGRRVAREVSLIMLDTSITREVLRFNLYEAWICQWHGAPLNALAQEVAIETMEVCFERLERVVPAGPVA